MKIFTAYWIGLLLGMLSIILLHELYFDTYRECKTIDGIEIYRTVHYGKWSSK